MANHSLQPTCASFAGWSVEFKHQRVALKTVVADLRNEDKLKLHPILDRPHEYDVGDFWYHVDRDEPSESFIEMTLRKDTDSVTLRFWQPVNLKIEEGFPQSTGGMVFYDRAADGLEDIKVEVADFESSWGTITFCARGVEKVGASS